MKKLATRAFNLADFPVVLPTAPNPDKELEIRDELVTQMRAILIAEMDNRN